MSRFTHLATTTVDVLRLEEVETRPGAWSREFVAVTVALGSRIAPAGAREMMVAEQMRVVASHVLYTEPDAGVHVQDELLETAGLNAGRRFRVTGLLPPSVPHHLKALLEEIQVATPA